MDRVARVLRAVDGDLHRDQAQAVAHRRARRTLEKNLQRLGVVLVKVDFRQHDRRGLLGVGVLDDVNPDPLCSQADRQSQQEVGQSF